MRYVLAFTSLALGAVLVLLGIAQLTVLSGPNEVVSQVSTNTKLHYSVLPASVLTAHKGQVAVSVAGKKAGFVGYGRTTDVEAWVAPFDHEVFAYDKARSDIEGRSVAGLVQQDFPEDAIVKKSSDYQNPAGSDLWLAESSGKGAQTVYIDATKDVSVLIASDGLSPQPSTITVRWIPLKTYPWFGPVMTLGAFFLILGGVLYLLAVDHDKRSQGPQRGQKGWFLGLRAIYKEQVQAAQERKSAKSSTSKPEQKTLERHSVRFVAIGVLASLATFGVTGCSARYWPGSASTSNSSEVASTASPSASAEGDVVNAEDALPPVPISEPHLRRIVSRIAETATEADKSMNQDLVKTRFAGSALAQRVANYKIRAAVNTTLPPLQITSNLLDYELVQSTDGWPRTILATTASRFPEGQEIPKDDKGKPVESAALALLLRQDSPYSNYYVHSVAEIRGGVTFPEAAPVEEGTTLLPADTNTLKIAPNEVGNAYGEILTQGDKASSANLFDLTDDQLIAQMGKAWLEKAQAEAAAKGESVEYSLEIKQADDAVTLSTGAGGALVSVTVNEKHIAKSTQDRGSVKLSPAVKALSGLDGSKKSVYQLWQHQMLFYVPSAQINEKVRVLGSTTAMTGAGEG